MLSSMARRHRVPVVYANQFGGNDDLVFDGRSCGFNADGAPIARGRSFDADVVICDLEHGAPIAPPSDIDPESEVWRALVLGTRDYGRKCGFTSAVLVLSGGVDVIADVPKTMVYRVSRWLNDWKARVIIPEPTLTKAPSAELRPNQTDQDSLPPYDVLDDILQRHIEQHQPAGEIVAAGFDAATVRRVLRLVRLPEFQRNQAAPGLKVTGPAFGTGWPRPDRGRPKLHRVT